jgi:hypothetical protein
MKFIGEMCCFGAARPGTGAWYRLCTSSRFAVNNHRSALLAAIFLSLFAIEPVRGQNVDGTGRFAFGTVSFTPSVISVAGHDSNLIRTPDSPGGSELYQVAQMEGWWKRGRMHAGGAGAVEYQRHPDQPKNTVWNNTEDLQVAIVSGIFRPSFTFTRHNHYAPPTDFSGFEFGIKARRVETEGEARLAVSVGARTSLVATGRVNATSYDADVRYQNVSLQESLNRTGNWLGLSLERTITAQTTLFALAESGPDRFKRSPLRDGRNTRIGGGVQTKPTALVGGSAVIGRRIFKSRLDSSTDFSGLFWRVAVATARARFLALVDTQRDLFASYNPLLGRYVASGTSAYLSVRVSPRVEAYATGMGLGLRYLSQLGTTSRYSSAGTGLAYRLGRFAMVGLTGEWYRQRGAGPYSGTRVTTYIQYGGGRIRRLDRPLPGERP